jgi:hypothetical protein
MSGRSASTRVHWCGRDYGSSGSSPRTWRQISGQQRLPLRALARYPPPLGLDDQELFAAVTPEVPRSSAPAAALRDDRLPAHRIKRVGGVPH